jgi:hypothetical protein
MATLAQFNYIAVITTPHISRNGVMALRVVARFPSAHLTFVYLYWRYEHVVGQITDVYVVAHALYYQTRH